MTVGARLTTGPGPDELEFEFAPDPEVTRVEVEPGHGTFLRRGQELPRFVRGDPALTIKAGNIIKERLLAGMDPMQAGEIDWDSL
jgi:hypothetical protein